MRIKLYFPILIVLFISLHESAYSQNEFPLTKDSECTTKRLDKPPGVASKVPIQDQDGTNLCVAYASTQLIDCWRMKNDPPVTQLISPLSLGIDYADITNHGVIGSFEPGEFLNRLEDLNFCSYGVVKDYFNSKKSADLLYELGAYYDQGASKQISQDHAAKKVYNCLVESKLTSKQNININELKEFLNETDRIKFINKVMKSICKNNEVKLRTKIPNPEVIGTYKYGSHQKGMPILRDEINKRLNQKDPQPIGISYCVHVLHDRNNIGISPRGYLNDSTCKDGAHASVIVGRRLLKYKDGNTEGTICQYLVRNSYGSSCNAYENDPAATPSEVCENGQIWVDEDALMHNTNEIYYLKDK